MKVITYNHDSYDDVCECCGRGVVEIVAVCEDDDVDRAITWLCSNGPYYSDKLQAEDCTHDYIGEQI